jgi:hypothetical protein
MNYGSQSEMARLFCFCSFCYCSARKGERGHTIAMQGRLAVKTRRALGTLVKLSGERARECSPGFELIRS